MESLSAILGLSSFFLSLARKMEFVVSLSLIASFSFSLTFTFFFTIFLSLSLFLPPFLFISLSHTHTQHSQLLWLHQSNVQRDLKRPILKTLLKLFHITYLGGRIIFFKLSRPKISALFFIFLLLRDLTAFVNAFFGSVIEISSKPYIDDA